MFCLGVKKRLNMLDNFSLRHLNRHHIKDGKKISKTDLSKKKVINIIKI